MTDSTTSPAPDVSLDLTRYASQLRSASEKNQLQLVSELAAKGEAGWQLLRDFLLERRDVTASVVEGKAYQLLYQNDAGANSEFLATYFPDGVVPVRSERGLDYTPLQQLLAQCDFQAADKLTMQNLCQLAGPNAVQRKWLYFTEVDKLPIGDLQTIDRLWMVYSEGKFGLTVQRSIWLGVGKNWDKMWPKIGWKQGNNWTRYPNQFTWDLTAPRGHLPLFNQLRGVRVFEKLLSHPAWD